MPLRTPRGPRDVSGGAMPSRVHTSPRGQTNALFLNVVSFGETGNREVKKRGVPRKDMPVRNGLAPPETSRGPRGLRRGIVHDLGRLYRLRQAIVVQRKVIPASTAKDLRGC